MEARELFRKLPFGKDKEEEEKFIEAYKAYICSEITINCEEPLYITDQFAIMALSDVYMDIYMSLRELYIGEVKHRTLQARLISSQKALIEMLARKNKFYDIPNPFREYKKEKKGKPLKIGYVYIAKQLNEKDVYKIGFSKNIADRENTFKIGNAYVKIIASLIVNEPRKIEKYIHDRLVEYKVSGEWFKIPDDLLSAIISGFGFSMGITK